jgi:hypothetical protein
MRREQEVSGDRELQRSLEEALMRLVRILARPAACEVMAKAISSISKT